MFVAFPARRDVQSFFLLSSSCAPPIARLHALGTVMLAFSSGSLSNSAVFSTTVGLPFPTHAEEVVGRGDATAANRGRPPHLARDDSRVPGIPKTFAILQGARPGS